MKRIEAKFSFFKAGQGSFYGGRIWDCETDQVFTVVYDCGTSTFIKGNSKSLNDEINYFKRRPHYFPQHYDEIELLFISHFDYDHVSGLKRLLTVFKVKNIILPYLSIEHRQFFLTSIPEDYETVNDLTIIDYISFIESPNQFISQNSETTNMFFIKPNGKQHIDYQAFDDNIIKNENVYPLGTLIQNSGELAGQSNVKIYDNNLQFFIKQYWEFTTYCQTVSQESIDKLQACLKKKLKIKTSNNLTLSDLKNIATTKRKEAHKCYTDCITDINSHGLVLLHGPISFEDLSVNVNSNCALNHFRKNYLYHRHFYDEHHLLYNKKSMLGTLLFGDTSINPQNNPIDFPIAFKDKLVNVIVVQVPHHGSSKNWDFKAFKALNIGKNVNRWGGCAVAVCNFGFGNKFGHPSHEVLDDLSSTIFLNSQFSRLHIRYENIFYKP
jgi:hypothetical protein